MLRITRKYSKDVGDSFIYLSSCLGSNVGRNTVKQSKLAFPNTRWLSSTPSNRFVSKGAGMPFDAPFLSASQSGLSESQLDVREAIRQITSQFPNDYWRDCDKESRCKFCIKFQ